MVPQIPVEILCPDFSASIVIQITVAANPDITENKQEEIVSLFFVENIFVGPVNPESVFLVYRTQTYFIFTHQLSVIVFVAQLF
jgi:hypothetical protein